VASYTCQESKIEKEAIILFNLVFYLPSRPYNVPNLLAERRQKKKLITPLVYEEEQQEKKKKENVEGLDR